LLTAGWGWVIRTFAHLATYTRPMNFFRDLSLSAIVTGFVVVLVGYTSTGAVVFQAAQALGATQAQVNSWMWALGIGMGVATIIPSLRYRLPIVAAWSTPGAALIASSAATSAGSISMPEATGAFLVSAILITLSGATGLFERLMNRIPMAIGSALLAGILLRFGIDTFAALKTAPLMIALMMAAFLLGRRFWPRYSVVGVLGVGIAVLLLQGKLDLTRVHFAWTSPEWVTPAFSWSAIISLGVPLFVVAMVSQNMPGIAVLRAAQNSAPVSPVTTTTGIVTFLLAPFGAFAINLAAITAAICNTPEAHAEPAKRYTAAVMAGVFYIVIGLFGAVVGTLFAAFPRELIVAVAGLALIGTIGNSLSAALAKEDEREAAMFTFLITASGISLFGIGAAFWGVVGGAVALLVLKRKK
jgi:benzoate membrane transport protein